MSNRSSEHKRDPPRQKRWYQFSMNEVAGFLGLYLFSFILCRFDFGRHHVFQNPMSNRNAAVWGLVLAVVVFAFHKLKDDK
jgi:hypothetical protein